MHAFILHIQRDFEKLRSDLLTLQRANKDLQVHMHADTFTPHSKVVCNNMV